MPRQKKMTSGTVAGNADTLAQKKHVLVAILGTAPAVLTEAVWALAMKENIVPDEIVVLTTAAGRDGFYSEIRDTKKWDQLLMDLKAAGKPVENVCIGSTSFEIFPDEKKNDAKDLLSYEANMLAANKMIEVLARYSRGNEWVVHGLIAGGRKTMTALFFSCMCIMARKDDKVYHVLVTPEYENRDLRPRFCYPQKGVVHKATVSTRVGNRTVLRKVELKSSEAEVNLFSVPFVRMGRWAEQMCLSVDRGLTYLNLINAVEHSLDAVLSPSVKIDLKSGIVFVADKYVKLYGVELAFFLCKIQGRADSEIVDMLKDLQFYMSDQGEDDLAGTKCIWLKKFKTSGIFGHYDQTNQEAYAKLLQSDCGHVKDRIKKKLTSGLRGLPEAAVQGIVKMFSEGRWLIDEAKFSIENRDVLSAEIQSRLGLDAL